MQAFFLKKQIPMKIYIYVLVYSLMFTTYGQNSTITVNENNFYRETINFYLDDETKIIELKKDYREVDGVVDTSGNVLFSNQNDSQYLQDAIDKTTSNGGGIIKIESGSYVFESINLKSNVHLIINPNVIIYPVAETTKNVTIFRVGQNINANSISSGFDINSTTDKFVNISIRSSDTDGEIITPYIKITNNEYSFNNNLVSSKGDNASKNYRERFVIDLTKSSYGGIKPNGIFCFSVGNVDNFKISDFHVIDDFTTFSCVGLGQSRLAGENKGRILNYLNSRYPDGNLDELLEDIFNKVTTETNGINKTRDVSVNSYDKIVNLLKPLKLAIKETFEEYMLANVPSEFSGQTNKVYQESISNLDRFVDINLAQFYDQYNRYTDHDPTNDMLYDFDLTKEELDNLIIERERIVRLLNEGNDRELKKQKNPLAKDMLKGISSSFSNEMKNAIYERVAKFVDVYYERSNERNYRFPTNGIIENSSVVNCHYGYGLIQNQSSKNVLFRDLFGDGGATLRLETGATRMNELQLFEGRAIDNIFARNIYCQDGKAALMIAPHLMRDNGYINVEETICNGCEYGVTLTGKSEFNTKEIKDKSSDYDIDGIGPGLTKEVYINQTFALYTETATIKIQNEQAYEELGIKVKSRSEREIMTPSEDGGKSVKGPSIAPLAVSAPFNCDVHKKQKFNIYNTFSSGFNFSPENPGVLIDNSIHVRDGYISCSDLNELLLSTDEILLTSSKNKCLVYPNPVSFDKKLFLNCDKIDSVVIYNTAGNIVKTFKNINTPYITINELSTGVYILVMYSKDKLISRNKIII